MSTELAKRSYKSALNNLCWRTGSDCTSTAHTIPGWLSRGAPSSAWNYYRRCIPQTRTRNLKWSCRNTIRLKPEGALFRMVPVSQILPYTIMLAPCGQQAGEMVPGAQSPPWSSGHHCSTNIKTVANKQHF